MEELDFVATKHISLEPIPEKIAPLMRDLRAVMEHMLKQNRVLDKLMSRRQYGRAMKLVDAGVFPSHWRGVIIDYWRQR